MTDNVRIIFPTLLIPIDDWGVSILSDVQKSLEELEPELIDLKWVSLAEKYSGNSPEYWGALLRDISSKLTRQPVEGYAMANPKYPNVHIMLVGSLSQYTERAMTVLPEIRSLFARETVSKQVKLSALLELNDAEEGLTKPKECLPELFSELVKCGWNHRIFLLSNYTMEGVLRCGDRDEEREAAVVFLEAYLLGEHWIVGQNASALLPPVAGMKGNQPVENAEESLRIFSGFDTLSLVSVLPNLRKYLTCVNVHEVLALADEGYQPDAGNDREGGLEIGTRNLSHLEVGVASAEVDDAPAFPRFNLTAQFWKKGGGVDNSVILSVFDNKHEIIRRLQSLVDGFADAFDEWWPKKVRKMPDKARELQERTPQDLNKTVEAQRQLDQKDRASKKNFLAEMAAFRDWLFGPVPTKPRDNKEWALFPFLNIRDWVTAPECHFNQDVKMVSEDEPKSPEQAELLRRAKKVKEALALFPNWWAWIIYSLIFILLQIFFTWPFMALIFGSRQGGIFVLVGTVLLLVITGYIAWRLPAWNLESRVRELGYYLNELVYAAQNSIRTNVECISNHWQEKGHSLEGWLQVRQAKRLDRDLAYLVNIRDQYKLRYTISPFHRDSLHLMPGQFTFIMDEPPDWNQTVRDLHQGPEKVVESIVGSDSFQQSWGRDNPGQILEQAKENIKQIYDTTITRVPGADPAKLMDKLISDFTNYMVPLIPIRTEYRAEVPQPLYCAFSPSLGPVMDQYFGKTPGINTQFNLRCDAHIYFYRVLDDFPITYLEDYEAPKPADDKKGRK